MKSYMSVSGAVVWFRAGSRRDPAEVRGRDPARKQTGTQLWEKPNQVHPRTPKGKIWNS